MQYVWYVCIVKSVNLSTRQRVNCFISFCHQYFCWLRYMITMSHKHNGDFNLGVHKLSPVRSVWHWLLKTRAGVEIMHTHINICSPAGYTLVVAKSCTLYQKVNHTTGATRIMHHELRAYAPLLMGLQVQFMWLYFHLPFCMPACRCVSIAPTERECVFLCCF